MNIRNAKRMPTLRKFLKATLTGGMLVLFPLFGCAYVFVRLTSMLTNFIKPLLNLVPGSRYVGPVTKDAASLIILLLLCFLIGIILRTSAGRALGRWLEQHFFGMLPGFSLFRHISLMIFGEEETHGAPVIVQRGPVKQFGFLIESNSLESTVFVPNAPGLLSGAVIIVKVEEVEKLNVAASEVARLVMRYGLGSNAILRTIDNSHQLEA